MENLFGLTVEAISEKIAPLGVPPYRARQIAKWMYAKGAASFDGMTDLPKSLRQSLAEKFSLRRAKPLDCLVSADRKTVKWLLAFFDGVAVEAVLMRQPYGNSVCLSTQAGCAMGCAFCASTLNGLTRNLTAGEMLAQFLFINEWLGKSGEKIDTLVLMGSGEPLLNYENVINFLRLLHAPYSLNFSYRLVTLSTSGIVERIHDLGQENLPLTLSISLHAPNDEIRRQIMPIAKKYPIEEVVAAGRDYFQRTGRRVTYEYILIEGVNASGENARELCRLLKNQNANINLIPINPVAERGLLRPSPETVNRFGAVLSHYGLSATVRKEMGSDISAACGQLRNRHLAGA